MSKFIYFFLIIVVGALVWGRVTKKEAPTPTKINQATQPQERALPNPSPTPDPLLPLLNNQRTTNLVETTELDTAAQKKCSDMQTRNYWAHSINGEFFGKFNPTSAVTGENLAKGYDTDQEIMANWLASPEHRANIKDVRYHYIGIARCNGPQHLLIVTEFTS